MTAGTPDRSRPPVTETAVASMICVIVGVIYIASYLPHRASLGPAVGLLAAAGALLVVNLAVISRQREFAWDRFFQVGRWTALAYAIIAGMLEYVFVRDHTHGSMLVVMTLMLVAFAANVTVILAFSVARYQPVRAAGS